MCGFRKLTVLCHGGSICEKVSTTAVCDTVDVAGIAIVFAKVRIDILKSIADIRKLVKYHTVGYEAVIDAEHKIAEPPCMFITTGRVVSSLHSGRYTSMR